MDNNERRRDETPAAVFNEAGLAMFLNFVANITGANIGGTGGVDSAGVNNFLAAWERHKAAKETWAGTEETAGQVDPAHEYKTLKSVMYGVGAVQLKHIGAAMQDAELWNVQNTHYYLKRFMDKYPGEIVNIGRGVYHWPTPDDIVLKFREGDNNNEQTT